MAEEKRTVIVDVKVNNDQAVAAMITYQNEIAKAKAEQAAFKDEIAKTKESLKEKTITEEEANAKIQEARQGLVKSQETQKAYNTMLRQTSKEIQNNITEQTRLEGSLTQLRAKLSNLISEYDNLSEAQRNSEDGKAKLAEINTLTDSIKGVEEDTQRFYRNVRNYANAIKEVFAPLFPEFTKVQSQLSFVTKALLQGKAGIIEVADGFSTGIEDAKLFAGAQRVVAVATTTAQAALKLFKVALVSTGIGAIVVLLGSLVSWIMKTADGTEFASKVMASLGASVDVLIDRFLMLGRSIASFLSGDFQKSGEELKAVFAGLGEELVNDTKQAWKLEEATIALDKQEAVLNARRAASKVELAELKRIADDTTKSEQERIEAAQKALEIEKREAEEAKELGALRIANMLGYTEVTEEVKKTLAELASGTIDVDNAIKNLGLSESTFEDFQKLTEMFGEFKQKEQEFVQMSVEGNNKLNSIRKEAAEARRAMMEKEVEEARAVIDMEIELMTDGFEKQRAEEEERSRREIEDLRKRLSTETDLTIAARESINRQIELAEKLHYQRMGAIAAEEQAVQLAKEQAHQAMLQAMGQKMTESSEAMIAELDSELAAEDASIDERNRLRWENQLMEARLRGENTLKLELQMAEERLNSMHQLEGESDEAFRNRQLKEEMNVAKLKEEISQYKINVARAELAAMSTITDSLAGLSQALGEDSVAGAALAKVVGLAQVAINTGVAISNIIAAATADPTSVTVFGRIANIAAGIIAVTTNMVTATKIIKGAKIPGGGGSGGGGSTPNISAGGGSSIPTVTEQLAAQSGSIGANVPGVSAATSASVQEQSATAEAMRSAVEGVQVVASWTEGQAVGKRIEFVESLGDV